MRCYLDGSGLRIPWENDSIKDIFDNLSTQQRNDITQEAQVRKNRSLIIK